MTAPLSVLLVGSGGYGTAYLAALLEHGEARGCRLVGVASPDVAASPRLDDLRAAGVPTFEHPDAFYAAHAADLAVLSTPIADHCVQIRAAVEQGSHVLCEKPLGATVQEVDEAIAVRDRCRRHVAVGYQWSYSEAIRTLKDDIMAGRFGAPKRLTTMACWPRSASYYRRNDWAGRVRDAAGRWVLDSPVNNALSHFLHNALYLLGSRRDCSAVPTHVTAELYRVNPIENYDTGVARCRTDGDVEILFFVTHAAPEKIGPILEYEFEDAVVRYAMGTSPLRAHGRDGRVVEYGNPDDSDHMQKLWETASAVRDNASIACGMEAAASQTLVMNGMQSCGTPIVDVASDWVETLGSQDDPLRVVKDIENTFRRCFDRRSLPSECGVPWAHPVRGLDLTHFDRYPAE